jgi:F0F1-type ATP synthase assembly protein I
MSEDSREMFRQLATYSHVGISFVLSIVIGFFIGWYLDNKVFDGKTVPYLTFLFLALGIAAGFKNLWDIIRDISSKS